MNEGIQWLNDDQLADIMRRPECWVTKFGGSEVLDEFAFARAVIAADRARQDNQLGKLVIDAEKRLLQVLGRTWTPAGISIDSLCSEIQARLAAHEAKKQSEASSESVSDEPAAFIGESGRPVRHPTYTGPAFVYGQDLWVRPVHAELVREKPYAYAVVIPAHDDILLVHDLDDAMEELTNNECEVMPLYLRPALKDPADRTEVNLLRVVYEAGRSLLRYNGVDQEKTIAAANLLEDAIEAVKELDGHGHGIYLAGEDPAPKAEGPNAIDRLRVLIEQLADRRPPTSSYDAGFESGHLFGLQEAEKLLAAQPTSTPKDAAP